MDKDKLVESLKKQLAQAKAQATQIYIIRLESTIKKLEEALYLTDEELIDDLQAVGFQDKAREIRRGMYV